MDVREAVRRGREFLEELFQHEGITDVGLEEVVFDDELNEWLITIGFFRPWNKSNDLATALGKMRNRSYKVVRMSNDGTIRSLTDRVLPVSQN